MKPLTFSKKNLSRANGRSTYIHPPSLAKIRQRTSEYIGNKQTNKQTNKHTNKRCSNYSVIHVHLLYCVKFDELKGISDYKNTHLFLYFYLFILYSFCHTILYMGRLNEHIVEKVFYIFTYIITVSGNSVRVLLGGWIT